MRWPPFKHVIFDCDSTLTSIEGVDFLAHSAGKGWRVSVLTEAAMNGDLALEEVFAKRLHTLRPTRGQIQAIRQAYKRNIVPDVREVIAALQELGHQVYIISGGLAEPVAEFGVFLGIPRKNIRAVGVEYDRLAGDWWTQTEERPNVAERYLDYTEEKLTVSDGKARIIQELLAEKIGRSLLIGDGVSDLLAGRAVDLFVGFGGVVRRPRVFAEAPVFIQESSMAPLLALAAGPAGLRWLEKSRPELKTLLERSKLSVSNGAIALRDERFRTKFNEAYQALHSWSDRGSTRDS